MARPWTLKALRVDVKRELPFGGRPSEQRWAPWGVELTDGTKCEAYQGAHSDYKGRTVDYYCGNPNKPDLVLLRDADQTDPVWRYDGARFIGGRYSPGPTVSVRVAWFAS